MDWVNNLLEGLFKKEVMVLVTCLFLFSCSPAKRLVHNQKIHGIKESGTYTVKSYKGSTATFYEFPGKYTVPSDTLKKGDKIFITVIRPSKSKPYAKNN